MVNMVIHALCFKTIKPDSRQSKTLILSTNVDKKSLGTVFDWRQIAIENTVSSPF